MSVTLQDYKLNKLSNWLHIDAILLMCAQLLHVIKERIVEVGFTIDDKSTGVDKYLKVLILLTPQAHSEAYTVHLRTKHPHTMR